MAACSFRWAFGGASIAGLLVGCSTIDALFGPTGVKTSQPPVYRQAAAAAAAASEPQVSYAGHLVWELQEAEGDRLDYRQAAGWHDVQRSLYDDTVWTLTPWLAYRLASPGWSDTNTRNQIVGSVAAVGAWRASLQERDPRRDAYSHAFVSLTCAMVSAGEYLYPADKAPGDALVAELDDHLARYEVELRELQRKIQLLPSGARAPWCASPQSPECRARTAALGQGGVDRRAEAAHFIADAQSFVDRAQRDRSKLRDLIDYIDTGAASTLRDRRLVARQTLDADLHAHDPGLASLERAVGRLSDDVQTLSAALAASSPASAAGTDGTSPGSGGGAAGPVVVTRLQAWRERAPLPVARIVQVSDAWDDAELAYDEESLRASMREAESAFTIADVRGAFTRASLREMGCAGFGVAPAAAAAQAAPAASTAGSSPAKTK